MITFRNLGKFGRFGNQLFQYAGTRLYAELNSFPYAFPDWIGTSLFEHIRPYTTLEHLRARILPTVQLADVESVSSFNRIQGLVRLWCQRDLRELYAHPSDNLDLFGYLQDPFSLALLATHASRVRSWFRLSPHIEHAFREATKRCPPWIGIHIRRGDFVRLGRAVPTSLYHEALTKLAPGIPIFISSDEPAVCTEFSRYPSIRPINPLPEVPDFVFDFWMLAHASTLYGCGSTFSWWAAYLGNKNNYYSPPLTHLWQKGYVPTLERQII